jgi:hypothetical protein
MKESASKRLTMASSIEKKKKKDMISSKEHAEKQQNCCKILSSWSCVAKDSSLLEHEAVS